MNEGLFKGRIAGYEPLSQLDYPYALSAVLFYLGCNLRCPYCYNAAVVRGEVSPLPPERIIDFLSRRKNILDGIVFSGGECTLWGNKLKEDMRYVKELGFDIKLDTNGSNPGMVKTLLDEGLLDYVAVDIKTHFAAMSKFCSVNTEKYLENLTRTMELLASSGIIYETRTTVHPDVTSEEDISILCKELKEKFDIKNHALQFFFSGPETLDSSLSQNPRFFDMDKVEHEGMSLELRNFETNEKKRPISS